MAARKIIIDTDPGQDDAIAIFLALASPEFDILGLSAVAGNVPLALTERNARALCQIAGATTVPVYAGCVRPMVQDLVTAENVHGHTGLDGSGLEEPDFPLQPTHAVDWLVDTLRAAEPGSITLCTLGPLTNIAMAFVKDPAVTHSIREIVMMGGGIFEGGNITPTAEFNFFVDPHAADVVFRSGCVLKLMPLDVTHKALTNAERLARFDAIGGPIGGVCHGMLSYFNRHDVSKYGSPGAPLHDPTVIAYLLQPDLFAGKDCAVEINLAPGLGLGQTVADWWGVTGKAANCTVFHDLDADGYFDLIFSRLKNLPLKGP